MGNMKPNVIASWIVGRFFPLGRTRMQKIESALCNTSNVEV